jgi:hypothetical protein
MQEKEYAQVYEMGLGSLIGDFFQNVKDTVTGVAKAVAPIAPFVLPFVAPGIGSLVGGKLGSFLASRVGQAALGAGIQGLAGKKPADIAKSLALQVATTGIQGALRGGEGTIGQKFMSGVTGREIPQVTNIPVNEKFANAIQGDINVGNMTPNTVTEAFAGANTPPPTPKKGFFGEMGDKFMASLDPRKRAINPEFSKMKALGEITGNTISDEAIISLGIPKESSFMYQYGPSAYGILSSLPVAENLYNQYINPPEEEDTGGYENLYASNPSAYQIGSITGYNPGGYYLPEGMRDQYLANQIGNEFMIPMNFSAKGGEVTGFAEGSGRQIEHPDGKVKDHPKRIGEIVGRGTGTSDDIPAMLSDGEFVMTAQAVRNAGGGSRKVGAKNMYKMMKSLENGGSLSQQSIGMA